MNVVCAQSASIARSHTKSHSVLIVWVKIVLLKLWLGHVDAHFAIVVLLHSNSTFGAMKMMLIWCHATGNFNRNTTAQTRKCHLPKAPMAFCSTSSTGPPLFWFASTSSTSAITKKGMVDILIDFRNQIYFTRQEARMVNKIITLKDLVDNQIRRKRSRLAIAIWLGNSYCNKNEIF